MTGVPARGPLPANAIIATEVPWHAFAAQVAKERWFALLDACDAPWVPVIASQAGPAAATCLYDGAAADDFWDTAPYLTCLGSNCLGGIREKLWTMPWGWFLQADCDLADLKHHFKRLVYVRLEDGPEVLFRFYDPRVLPDLLLAMDPVERASFFGPIRSIAVGFGDRGAAVRVWACGALPTGSSGTMVIRRPVLDALAKSQWRRFVALAKERLQVVADPDRLEGDGWSLEIWVEAVGRQVGALGITDEEDVLRLLEAMLGAGWTDLSALPGAVREVLEDPAIPGADKVDRIHDLALFDGPTNGTEGNDG